MKIVSLLTKLIKWIVLKRIAILFIITLWPLSLFFANTPSNFIHYLLPSLLILILWIMYSKGFRYYFLPIFFIPIIDPKLALIPLLFFLINLVVTKNKEHLICLIISVVILGIFWKPFYGQTILRPDYEGGQLVIQKSNLYNSIPLARIFQNKPRIILDKFSSNFFSLVDPNNYFFGFMPRQILIDNQNLNKFPFVALIFAIYGLINIESLKRKGVIISLLIAGILNLSLLGVFDRQDFILFIPLCLIIIHGIDSMEKKHKNLLKISLLLTIFFAIPETIRTFIQFKR